MKRTLLYSSLAVAITAAFAIAQNPPAPPQGGEGQGGDRPPRRPPPLIAALDANHDGVIDAAEIANAPNALKTLDKNGDGKLTREELMPPGRPGDGFGPRRHRDGSGPNGPGGPGQKGPGQPGQQPPQQ